MILDLKSGFGIDDVRRVIASETDDRDWILRVNREGVAYLQEASDASGIEDCMLVFDTWEAGNGYVGTDAARDDEWVGAVFTTLNRDWQNPAIKHVEVIRKR